MTHWFWLSQCFGGLAIFFDAVKFSRRNRGALLLWGIPAGWSMVASQYLLGQGQGATFQAMSSMETLLQAGMGKNHPWHWRFRLVTATVFGAMGFWILSPTPVWFTWLPVGAYLFGTMGKIFHNPIHIRVVWIFSSACILWYSLIYGNVTMILQQIMVLSLTAWVLVKAYRQKASPSMMAREPLS